MIQVAELADSSPLLDRPEELRRVYQKDGVVFLRGVMDAEVIARGRALYREALVARGLIDPAREAPVWTGKQLDGWRLCNVLGTTFWPEVVAQPLLNRVLRDMLDEEPVWIPITVHRTAPPTGALQDGQDIFAGRHQDAFVNEGMQFTTCWIPIGDIAMDSGSFAVAPGLHKRGILHNTAKDAASTAILPQTIPPEAWRSASFRAGDVLIFNYMTPHAALPNLSNEFRLSIDVRAIPASAPQPVIGAVDRVAGSDVTIRTDAGELVTVRVTERTLIRDILPWPRIPLAEVERLAYPGSRVMAMARPDRTVTVLRRNAY